MRYILEIKECKFLGKGKEGSVYLTPEGFALKVFYKKRKLKMKSKYLRRLKIVDSFQMYYLSRIIWF